MEVSNPFENQGEARRYQLYRPRYHHLPFGMIRSFVGRDFESSLDVACGTGHSTEALATISARIIGCDLSDEMLNEARANQNLEFVKASAENLPFPDSEFDFVNISMGFHWLEQEKFLSEVRRVLRENGYLSIDSYGFSGKISDDPEKQRLHEEFFKQSFPPASRRSGYPSAELCQKAGMLEIKQFNYEHQIAMDEDAFENLLMTWSNFQILLDPRKTEVAREMRKTYGQIFSGRKLALGFSGKAILFRFV